MNKEMILVVIETIIKAAGVAAVFYIVLAGLDIAGVVDTSMYLYSHPKGGAVYAVFDNVGIFRFVGAMLGAVYFGAKMKEVVTA